MRKPEQVIKSVMDKLKKHGKGIVLMHDFQHATAEALPELLRQMKAGGYKVVQMKARDPVVFDGAVRGHGSQDRKAADDQRAPDIKRGAHDRRVIAFVTA